MIPLRIVGMGMFTAAGKTAEHTWSAVVRRVPSPRETSIAGSDGRPLIASLALPLAPELTGLARALALARSALAECVAQVNATDRPPTALLLCIPPPLRSAAQPSSADAARAVDPRAGWNRLLGVLAAELVQVHGLPLPALVAFEDGRAAGILALRRAAELLEAGEVDQCLVGGIDSTGHAVILKQLDQLGVSRSTRHPHGIVPGEGAVFLCLRRGARPSSIRAAEIVTAQQADEPEPRPRYGVFAHGLTTAMVEALKTWGGPPREIAVLAADLESGIPHAKEAIHAATLALWGTNPELYVLPPFDIFGDVGAATVPLLVGLAARWLLERPSGRAALVACGSATTLRGAAIVTTTTDARSTARDRNDRAP